MTPSRPDKVAERVFGLMLHALKRAVGGQEPVEICLCLAEGIVADVAYTKLELHCAHLLAPDIDSAAADFELLVDHHKCIIALCNRGNQLRPHSLRVGRLLKQQHLLLLTGIAQLAEEVYFPTQRQGQLVGFACLVPVDARYSTVGRECERGEVGKLGRCEIGLSLVDTEHCGEKIGVRLKTFLNQIPETRINKQILPRHRAERR